MSGVETRLSGQERVDVLANAVQALTDKSQAAPLVDEVAEVMRNFPAFDADTMSQLIRNAVTAREQFGGPLSDQVGQLVSALQFSPAGKPELTQFLKNSNQAVLALSSAGFNLREGLALFTSQQARVFDPEGAAIRTNLINQFVKTVPQVLRGR